MNDQLISKIKLLRHIKPEEAFAQRSKKAIFRHTNDIASGIIVEWRNAFKFGLALVLASGFVIMLFVGNALTERLLFPFIFPGLHSESVASELENFQIQIKLADVEYYSDSPRLVSVALKETAPDTPSHLNNLLLQHESDLFEVDNTVDETKKVNDVLKQLL
ncbi:MAG: hypothetical protein HY456_03120 [Parcubacteria group bacterium]|nr:hypothetical protein [Parcubacteria group bacterium]